MRYKRLIWPGLAMAASVGLYLRLALRYPLGPSLDNPRASWASMVGMTSWNALWHLALYLGLTLLYITILRLLKPRQGDAISNPRVQIILILVAWLACSAALLAAAPAGESHDIFDYIFRGRMMAEYGGNPLVDIPRSYGLSTPYARYLAWWKNVDTYGPVWEGASFAVASAVRQGARGLGWWLETRVSCPNSPEACRLLVVYITAYRLLAIILSGLSGWLVYSMVRRNRPALAPLALAVWLLSPMTLIATALGGHNDAVMLVLVLLGWWLLQRRQLYLALLALILAAHVKLTALIWLPTCVLWMLWRRGWRRTLKVGLASAASGLALSWLLYAPFGGWQTLPRMLQERSVYVANSVWRILKFLLTNNWDWPVESAHQLSVNLPSWSFAIAALLLSLWMFNLRLGRWRFPPVAPEEQERILWRALGAVSLLYLAVGSFWFQHWYVLWVMAPAALLPDSRSTRLLLPWLVFGALSSNAVVSFALTPDLLKFQSLLKYVLPVALTWGPVVLATLTIALARRWAAGKAHAATSRYTLQN